MKEKKTVSGRLFTALGKSARRARPRAKRAFRDAVLAAGVTKKELRGALKSRTRRQKTAVKTAAAEVLQPESVETNRRSLRDILCLAEGLLGVAVELLPTGGRSLFRGRKR